MNAAKKLSDQTLNAANRVLTREAYHFISELHHKFENTRQALLQSRQKRQQEIDAGEFPSFLTTTREIRESNWKVAPCPRDLEDRRVEITGPVERKMMINALNSGAKTFMADFEDSLSPTWANIIEGQANLIDAVRRELSFTSPEGKSYRLNEKTATLLVRPRGWHLIEKNVLVNDSPISASLFDFGLYFFHNAHELVRRGSAPYFYLPKMENHLEARLWNDVFKFAQDYCGITHGTIRATVLIETILAAFEMDEILFELREHSAGLNAGRWDYIFSVIKKFSHFSDFVLPDRSQITMTVPFMKTYSELLVHTCHRREAHAMGGMAAFIPNRKDLAVTENALKKVREDKEREAATGFDGTWVAHPDLVPVAMEIFDRTLGANPNQKNKYCVTPPDVATALLDVKIPNGAITEAGLRNNINVALQYLGSWLNGVGAVAISNLMEDAATAEISRAQIWQWIHHGASLASASRAEGLSVTIAFYRKLRDEELTKLGAGYEKAAQILDQLVTSREFTDFLTIPAYEYLN